MYMENQLILEKGAKTTLQRECDGSFLFSSGNRFYLIYINFFISARIMMPFTQYEDFVDHCIC